MCVSVRVCVAVGGGGYEMWRVIHFVLLKLKLMNNT